LRRKLFSVLGASMLCLTVAPARAGLQIVVIDSSFTKMTITEKTSASDLTGTIKAEDSNSRLTVRIQDSVTGVTLDGVRIDGFDLSLTFDFLGSDNSYSAVGAFQLADRDVTEPWDIMAQFTSTNVSLSALAGVQMLLIEGTLGIATGESSILVGSSPWIFTGDAQHGTVNGDTVAETVRIADPSLYITGGLVALHYPVYGDYESLEALFDSLDEDSVLDNGSMHAQVTPVPIPAGVMLGFLGLAVAGLKLRQLA